MQSPEKENDPFRENSVTTRFDCIAHLNVTLEQLITFLKHDRFSKPPWDSLDLFTQLGVS